MDYIDFNYSERYVKLKCSTFFYVIINSIIILSLFMYFDDFKDEIKHDALYYSLMFFNVILIQYLIIKTFLQNCFLKL